MSRRTVDNITSEYIWSRDGAKCVYCGDYGAQVDHVLPVKWGGPTIDENLVLACRSCNMKKRGDVIVEYLVWGFQHLLLVGEDLTWTDKFEFGNAVKLNLNVNSVEIRLQKRSQTKSIVPLPVSSALILPEKKRALRSKIEVSESWHKVDNNIPKCQLCGTDVAYARVLETYCSPCWDELYLSKNPTKTVEPNRKCQYCRSSFKHGPKGNFCSYACQSAQIDREKAVKSYLLTRRKNKKVSEVLESSISKPQTVIEVARAVRLRLLAERKITNG